MLATEKQLNCIENIRYNINYCNEYVPQEADRNKRDLCLKDYKEIYKGVKGKTLTKKEASCFISKWIDFSKNIYVKHSNRGSSIYQSREVGLYCESDLFLTEMFY